MDEQQLKDLQKKLGYKFKDPSLLTMALTHSSFANENKNDGIASNERLEFLGDSVLGMTVAALIFSSMPDMPEGQMTRRRAELVCEKNLATLAATLNLGEYILLGRGEDKGGGRRRPSMLADAVEAVLAAIYLDGGFTPVKRFVSKFFLSNEKRSEFENTDYKTSLQEIIQEKPGQTLSYQVSAVSGPDHMKSYTVEVRLNGTVIGGGTGKSKKKAEQAAARDALAGLS